MIFSALNASFDVDENLFKKRKFLFSLVFAIIL